MKEKLIKLLIVTAVLMLGIQGCEKAPVNGDLDGQWQLIGIERDGNYVAGEDRYLRIQLDIAQLVRSGWVPIEGTGIMKYSGDRLEIDFANCVTPEEVSMLQPWGIYENPVVFHIEELTSKSLVLKNGNVTSRWRKF